MAVRINAIIQIHTNRGYAYAHYSHKLPGKSPIIRVLEGFDQNPQTDLDRLVRRTTRFFTFFPLKTAVKQKKVEIIGYHPVPEFAQQCPVFKVASSVNPATKKLNFWAIWDGEKTTEMKEFSEEQKNYPTFETMTSWLLRERLETGWSPRDDIL
jgi:hypothetical protein